MKIDRNEFTHAIMLLDACEEALEMAAKAEARKKPIGIFRQITHQKRAEHIKAFVAKYSELIA